MKITTGLLRRLNACGWQIDFFRLEWPDGVEVTERNVLRALALGLDMYWLVMAIASPQGLMAYREVEKVAREAHSKAVSTAKREYDSAWDAYINLGMARVKEEFWLALAQAREEYWRAVAPAIVIALLQTECDFAA